MGEHLLPAGTLFLPGWTFTQREARRRERGPGAFLVVAPDLWNELPNESGLFSSLASFKNQLKTHGFNCCQFKNG